MNEPLPGYLMIEQRVIFDALSSMRLQINYKSVPIYSSQFANNHLIKQSLIH
jgi:hypothetical protein